MRVAPLVALPLLLLAGCQDDGPDAPGGGTETGTTVAAPFALEFRDAGEVTAVMPATTPANPDGCTLVEREGLDIAHHPWTVPSEFNGSAIAVSGLTARLHIVAPTLLDADLFLLAPGGAVLGSATAFNVQTGPDETITVTGELQAGEYTLVVRACAGRGAYEVSGAAMVHYVVEVPAVPAPSA